MGFLWWWFCSKGEGLDLFPSPFSNKQFSLDHHNFVILSGLKAFRLQKIGIAVYILYIHTSWGDVIFSVAVGDGLIMSPNLSLIPPVCDMPEWGNDRRCSSVRLRFQFHNNTHNAVLNTRVPSWAHNGKNACLSINIIKTSLFKTDNWLIDATATGLEVKGMYTSQNIQA